LSAEIDTSTIRCSDSSVDRQAGRAAAPFSEADDGYEVSVWTVPLSDIQAWVDRQASDGWDP